MSRRHYKLPPLTTLTAFEAAARHLSFKNAAEELAVTPGAVSHQIKALEGELSTALFQRKHRGVELTADGQALFETLSSSFSRISHSLETIRTHSAPGSVTIGSTSAVSQLYLARAVIRFWREHPDAVVNQIVRDRSLHDDPAVDIYIRYGQKHAPDMDHVELYRDQLVPVSGPDTARRLRGCDLDALARERLIYLDSEDRTWTNWPEWFEQLGYDGPIAPGLRVNNYSVALQAAQEGAGITLGWQRLIDPLLQTKRLVTIEPHRLAAPHGFHLISRREAELPEIAKNLKDWIITEIRADHT